MQKFVICLDITITTVISFCLKMYMGDPICFCLVYQLKKEEQLEELSLAAEAEEAREEELENYGELETSTF